MKRNDRIYLWLALFMLFLYSCNSEAIYREGKDIAKAEWHKNHVLNYQFEINDTLQPYTVYLNVRNKSKYQFRNLFLFIETTSPAGQSVRDTFECMLADERGEWYGKGWGDIYENKIPYKKYIRFPRTGKYSIEIQHAMRRTNLKHITDIGLIIEKAKNPHSD